MFQLIFVALALLGATLQLAASPSSRRDNHAIVGTYLLWLFFVYVGLMGLVASYAHIFRPEQTSASIGWAMSPYEHEVAMADLAIGVLGVLCVKFRGNFWLATAIGNAVWLLGDAFGHLKQLREFNDHAANNGGLFLVLEFTVPVVILTMTLWHRAKR